MIDKRREKQTGVVHKSESWTRMIAEGETERKRCKSQKTASLIPEYERG